MLCAVCSLSLSRIADRGNTRMLTYRHYVPLLRSKAAEWLALESLPIAIRGKLTPVMEFPPSALLARPKEAKKNGRSAAEHALRIFFDHVVKDAARGRLFVDLGQLGDRPIVEAERGWQHVARVVTLPAGVVPVVWAHSKNARTWSDVRKVASSTGSGLCLRVAAGMTPITDLARTIQTALNTLGVTPDHVDLIVDLGRAPGHLSHDDLRNALPSISAWRSWTVLAGVFPKDLSQFSSDTLVHRWPREDWRVWREHVTNSPMVRRPSFGDFTIQYGEFFESPKIAGSLSVRYTLDSEWLILRGKKANKEEGATYEQFHGHARYLCRQPLFFGRGFSAGDEFIASKQDAGVTPGNTKQWLAAGINHHMTAVVAQLEILDASNDDGRRPAAPRG